MRKKPAAMKAGDVQVILTKVNDEFEIAVLIERYEMAMLTPREAIRVAKKLAEMAEWKLERGE